MKNRWQNLKAWWQRPASLTECLCGGMGALILTAVVILWFS